MSSYICCSLQNIVDKVLVTRCNAEQNIKANNDYKFVKRKIALPALALTDIWTNSKRKNASTGLLEMNY